MANIQIPKPWNAPRREITPEEVYRNRREFLRTVTAGAVGATALSALGPASLAACGPATGNSIGGRPQEGGPLSKVPDTPTAELYPKAPLDTRFTPGPRHGRLTDERIVATHNNFYEFGTDKSAVWQHVDPYEARPWHIEVTGRVDNPGRYDLVELERAFELEERIYRLRCVEAWSVVVPWIGFPLRKLIERAQPQSGAQYVRFVSFDRPEQAVGQKQQTWYPWPYYEALRMDEAMNDLSFVVTGMYEHPLLKQNGAPLRLATPWKYGYKSAKAFDRIEFTSERPPTFWNDLQVAEYGWYSNVDPAVDHPRWTQASEEIVATGERVPTLPFNGYGEFVGHLYDGYVTPPGDVPHAAEGSRYGG